MTPGPGGDGYARVAEWWGRRALLATLAISIACSPPPKAPRATPQPCSIVAAASPDSLLIAVSSPLTPGAIPTNDAERLVDAQLYDPLIRADCAGNALPALARSWRTDASRTRITLVLRDDARFSTGDPLTARDVVAAWRASAQRSGERGALAGRIANATTIVDDRTLLVSLPDTNLLVLAEPALAVYRPGAGSGWPVGAGPYRIAAFTPAGLTLVPVVAGSGPRLDIYMKVKGADARDAIDAGSDVLVTADPAAVSYAATLAGHAAIPLPWNATYVLASPNRLTVPATTFTDAVRAETRAPAAAPAAWWRGITGCELNVSNVTSMSTHDHRIAYEASDDVARQLAERLVALGVAPSTVRLGARTFDMSLRAGDETAYVVRVPAQSLAPCADASALLAAMPWLGPDPAAWTGALAPLVDTRSRMIVRTDRVSASIDWNGVPRFGAPAAAGP